ncbi:MAG: class I SAM-dependent methyltransferase [Patulibacter sp.]|nr:class I SAM-dependent methyltransferase [Patulibacter sp.]
MTTIHSPQDLASDTAAAERYAREQVFHDHTFGEDARAGVGKFYSATARSYDQYAAAVRRAPVGAAILEYGCGPGSLAFDLGRAGYDVTGIDISPVAIEQATQRAADEGLSERVRFVVMNAEAMTLDDDSFDVVCGSGIIHHLDIDRALSEISRVLRPGGRAVFVEPLAHNPGLRAFRALTPKLRTPDEHPLTMSDLDDFQRRFPGATVSFHALFTLGAMAAYGRRAFPAVLARLESLDDATFRRLPWLRRWAWMTVLEGRVGP